MIDPITRNRSLSFKENGANAARQIRRKENMIRDEALKLAERIAKHPAPVTSQQAKRALIMLFLKTLEQHLKPTK